MVIIPNDSILQIRIIIDVPTFYPNLIYNLVNVIILHLLPIHINFKFNLGIGCNLRMRHLDHKNLGDSSS